MQIEVSETEGLKNALREQLAATLRIALDEDSDDRDLLAEGLIDSMAVMELVAYMEDTLDIVVDDEEIIADNFRSLDRMAGYVGSKRAGVEFFSPYVESVREFVAQATPPEAFVLLLNSGDRQLVEVSGRRVWPFPCDERGTWGATGHPADGQEAIAWLERLRGLGASHIVFLDPELWWLDHYDGLRAHLELAGGPVAQSHLGVAYPLSPAVR